MNKILPILFFLLVAVCIPSHAQEITVTGIISDTSGKGLFNASIVIKKTGSNKIAAYTFSRALGKYTITLAAPDSTAYLVEVNHLGYKKQTVVLHHPGAPFYQLNFIMHSDVKTLEEVVIRTTVAPVVIKNDTTEYNASAFANAETRKVEDLLKNIPGFKVEANGKISYNGKEVEKILIDGTDLASKKYTLVSKNLSAYVVDKIQVIDNYNDNTVLRQVTESGKVGINLKIKKGLAGKMSGTVEGGTSFFQRNFFDINQLGLGTIKTLAIANYNNTGATVARQNITGDDNLINYPFAANKPDGMILDAGSIYIPPLSPGYTYNNNDHSTAFMAAWQSASGAKKRALLHYAGTRSENIVNRASATVLDSVTSWSMQSDEKMTDRNKTLLVNYSSVKGNDKRFSQLNIDAVLRKYLPSYLNNVTGAITDTAAYSLNTSMLQALIQYEYTSRINLSTVFNFGSEYALSLSDENYQANTTRLRDHFGLADIYTTGNQLLQGRYHRMKAYAKWLRQHKNIGWAAGIITTLEDTDTRGKTSFSASSNKDSVVQQPQSKTIRSFYQVKLSGDLQVKLNRHSILLRTVTGNAFAGTSHLVTSSSAEWNYRKTKKMSFVQTLMTRYQFVRKLPAIRHFFVPGLLSGNATVLIGASLLVPEINHSIVAMYSIGNSLKQNTSIIRLMYSVAENSYMEQYHLTPGLSVISVLPSPRTTQFNSSMSTSAYLKPVKTRLEFNSDVIMQQYETFTNGALYHNKVNTLSLSVKMSTAFRYFLNAEGSFTINRSGFTTKTSGFNNEGSLFTDNSYLKLKLTPCKKLYAAALFNNYKFSPRNRFWLTDIYLNYQPQQKLSMSLIVHNLGNRKSIREKNITPFFQSGTSFAIIPGFAMVKVSYDF